MDGGSLAAIHQCLLTTRVATLTFARTSRASIGAMITAVCVAASGDSFPLFDLAVAATVSAILISHGVHLLSLKFL